MDITMEEYNELSKKLKEIKNRMLEDYMQYLKTEAKMWNGKKKQQEIDMLEKIINL